ncbi:DNA cytosine methyltransferase [Sphingomonas sp. FUKUSWIS1]|uniref:DNA cytosine methyltransferase n=1 Tax=Sphingomonas sp. FUKUSWIS1 TaxID=1379701 RepID=UPI0009DD45F3|nr:DNA cytosine methyltransferase [Sphingomonas sp. FUKUSWIS1]
MIKKNYSVADFFAGCGGLSYGFALTGRFDVILGSDIKPEALATFTENHENSSGKPATILEDIKDVSANSVSDRLAKFGVNDVGQLDCLIGGPPCEGFSQNRSLNSGGKKVDGASSRTNRFMDDPRNELFKWFVNLGLNLKPKVMLIENVPDIVRHKDGETLREIINALDHAGYISSVRVLHAADYGVPQMRRRAIFLCQRKEDYARTGLRLKFPTATHRPFPLHTESLEGDENWLPGASGYWPSVREALGDLPAPTSKLNASQPIKPDYPAGATSPLRQYYRLNATKIYNHIDRPLGKSGLEKVLSIVKGQSASDLPTHLKPKSSYHYSYSRLRWSEPARTITKFCYHVGSGMFTHPEENRALTMREAARLQTFPDSFRFMTENIRDLSAMIGSAVPPILASRLGQSIAEYLDDLQFMSLSLTDKQKVKPQATDAVMKRLQNNEWGQDSNTDPQAILF